MTRLTNEREVERSYKELFTKGPDSIRNMSGRTEWRLSVSTFAEKTCNPIRTLVESLNIQPHPDKPMIALSIGDPTIFGNLRAPEEAMAAVRDSIASGSWDGYAAAAGHLSARQAVAEYSSVNGLQVNPNDVFLCSGCSSSLEMCILCIAEPGQNILLPRPGFSIYATLALAMGIYVKYYNLIPERHWEIDLEQLEEEIDENTACIIINNPSNPCGSVFRPQHLEDILAVAEKHYLPIIADEIYEHLVFPGEVYKPIASLTLTVPVLSCSGLTKRFLVPGWRMGWIIIHDRNNILADVRRGLTKLSQRTMGSNTLIQGALPAILKSTPCDFYNRTIKTLHKHAELVYERLSKISGLEPVMPQGAMYMMVRIDMSLFPDIQSSIDLVEKMVAEESVFCLPGDCFQYRDSVRLVLTAPPKMLDEACDRIERFCYRHCCKERKVGNAAKGGVMVKEQQRLEKNIREP